MVRKIVSEDVTYHPKFYDGKVRKENSVRNLRFHNLTSPFFIISMAVFLSSYSIKSIIT